MLKVGHYYIWSLDWGLKIFLFIFGGDEADQGLKWMYKYAAAPLRKVPPWVDDLWHSAQRQFLITKSLTLQEMALPKLSLHACMHACIISLKKGLEIHTSTGLDGWNKNFHRCLLVHWWKWLKSAQFCDAHVKANEFLQHTAQTKTWYRLHNHTRPYQLYLFTKKSRQLFY